MRTIKLALGFIFMLVVGMSVNTVSVSNHGFSIQIASAEAAQATTTTTTNSSKPYQGKINKGKVKHMTVKQVDLGLVTDKSPIINFLETNNKWIRALLVVFSVLIGLSLFIFVGLGLKQRADEGSVKHPTSKIVVTMIAATLTMNFYKALGWFVPNGDTCNLSGFQSSQCGNTPMPVTGALADELLGAANAAGSSAPAFLGDGFAVLNSASYFIMALGAVSFLLLILHMNKMYSDPQTPKDFSKLARVAIASVIVMNHRALIEAFVNTLKLMGFGA